MLSVPRRNIRALAAGAISATLALSVSVAPGVSASPHSCTIDRGWDLFETMEGTRFDPIAAAIEDLTGATPAGVSVTGIAFRGVPLGQFDFGTDVGVHDTGSTDTIVQRHDAVGSAAVASAHVGVEITALQLQATGLDAVGARVPLPFYVTLQSRRGANPLDPPAGPRSTGVLGISFNADCSGGTADSAFDVYFDVRAGAIDGPVVSSLAIEDPVGLTTQPLHGDNLDWGRAPVARTAIELHPPAAQHMILGPPVLLDRVNHNLPGGDFYVGAAI